MKPDSREPFESCPICSSTEIRFSLELHYWKEYPLRFFECESCGSHFANPMPSDEVIRDGNNALVRWYQQGRSFESEFRDARQSYLRGRLLAKRLGRWKPEGRLLDLGCYNGFLPLAVKDHSRWEAEGLEISDELSSFTKEKLGVTCHNGTLERLNLPAEHYDFILCHDLIEHINDPRAFLQELFRILKPGGRIQIITPNVRQDLAFAKRAFQAGKPLPMLLNHILLFSPESLRIALEGVGLRVRKLHCYDVRHVAKDMGWFGLGKPGEIPEAPSMEVASKLPLHDLLSEWTPERIEELRSHRKVSRTYGFFRETLPKALTIRLPPAIGVGHEIYAMAEKGADIHRPRSGVF